MLTQSQCCYCSVLYNKEERETGPVSVGRSWDSSPDGLVPESFPRSAGLRCFSSPKVRNDCENTQAENSLLAQPEAPLCVSQDV